MPTETSPESPAAGEFKLGRVLTLSGAHALHDTFTSFVPPLLPVFIEQMSLSTTQAGLVSTMLQLPSLALPLIGQLAERHNLRLLVVLGLAGSVALMSLLGVLPGYWALALCLATAGITSACFHAVGPVMAGNVSGRRLGRGLGIWMVGGELGVALGPIVVVSAVGWLTLRGLPWLMVAGLAIVAMLAVGLRGTPLRAPGGQETIPWRQALTGLRPVLGPLGGIIVARSLAAAALSTYLPTLLSQQGASLWLSGASLSLVEIAGVVGVLAAGSLSDRLGRRRVILIHILATPLLMFAFLAADGWLRLPLLFGLGLIGLSVTPVLMAVAQESMPESRALANGVYQSATFVAKAAAVAALGAMGDLFGLSTAFAASGAILLLGLPLLFLLPRKMGLQAHPHP